MLPFIMTSRPNRYLRRAIAKWGNPWLRTGHFGGVFGGFGKPDKLGSNVLTAGTGGQYTSPSSALAAGASGQTVLMLPGSYTIDTYLQVPDGVSLIGMGERATMLTAGGTHVAPALRVLGNNHVAGFLLTANETSAAERNGVIEVRGSNHVFENLRVIEDEGHTITRGQTSQVTTDAHRWGGNTRFRNCYFEFDDDFLTAPASDGEISTGTLDMYFENCVIRGVNYSFDSTAHQASGFLQTPSLKHHFKDCVIDLGLASDAATSLIYTLAYKSTTAVTGANWTAATRTITKAAAFASYTWRRGDKVLVTAGTGATVGRYEVQRRVDDDNIVLMTSMGADIADNSLAFTLAPVYEIRFDNCTVKCGSTCATNGLFRLSRSLNGTGCGYDLRINGGSFELPAATKLFLGATQASPFPQSNAEIRGVLLPADGTYTNINGTNQQTVQYKDRLARERAVAVTSATTITLDPNLGTTHIWTSGHTTTLAARAEAYTNLYDDGQLLQVVIISDGTGRTTTPDNSTIKGEAITTTASAGTAVTATYRWTGSYWVQVGATQETGY